MKRVAVLGATGSIGRSALDVIRAARGALEPVLLAAKSDKDGLEALDEEFPSARTVLTGRDGQEALLNALACCRADVVVNGIAGSAGLLPSLAALETGADLALANKETIVMAGKLAFRRALSSGARIIPVDSEHAAIFHLLRGLSDAQRASPWEVILTASGGPFRSYTPEQLKTVTAAEALSHPTWKMGPKITVDSASLANKGLEVIEAVRLFDVSPQRVKVVIHPQSIVHSMVRLADGAVYAQLSRPDMRLPIHEALFYPQTAPSPFGRLDFDGLFLSFERPDQERFPMLRLAYEALEAGGLAPVVYNAAGEAATIAFLEGAIPFLDIPRRVEYALSRDWPGAEDDLEAILETDRQARLCTPPFYDSLSCASL